MVVKIKEDLDVSELLKDSCSSLLDQIAIRLELVLDDYLAKQIVQAYNEQQKKPNGG